MAARIMAIVFGIIGSVGVALTMFVIISDSHSKEPMSPSMYRDLLIVGFLSFGCIVLACFFGAIAAIHGELIRMRKSMTRIDVHNQLGRRA